MCFPRLKERKRRPERGLTGENGRAFTKLCHFQQVVARLLSPVKLIIARNHKHIIIASREADAELLYRHAVNLAVKTLAVVYRKVRKVDKPFSGKLAKRLFPYPYLDKARAVVISLNS